jgi:hypothetical protein
MPFGPGVEELRHFLKVCCSWARDGGSQGKGWEGVGAGKRPGGSSKTVALSTSAYTDLKWASATDLEKEGEVSILG